MAEPNPPAAPAAPAAAAAPPPPKPPVQNPALRMMGLPALPRKLPSRNWMIFWTLSSALAATIIYDRREKKRATARWAHAVEHLAKRPLANPSQMPRKVTIYLEAPPGDGLRVAQDHYSEYIKPVLAASGLDWDFVQGRQQGDIRAAVAERDVAAEAATGELPTEEDRIDAWRQAHGVPLYDGVRGDIVIGRHAWKEYTRGLHEGWLGPLEAPPHAQPDPEPESEPADAEADSNKTKRPPQIKPYNSPEDYATAHLPMLVPSELAPSVPLTFPHILGFLNTPTRFVRFLTRRKLADEVGREVAAVCLAAYREYREEPGTDDSPDAHWEQQRALAHEEKDWVKSVWKEDKEEKKTATKKGDDASPLASGSELVDGSKPAVAAKEKIWPRPMVIDQRIGMRMRRFELLPEDEERARGIVVPEEEVEGWDQEQLEGPVEMDRQQFPKGGAEGPHEFRRRI
ncbi:hypothetical protein INS49_000870 [Diaporthe citri]|uniref:uncharacterized protein n=1 Tax=Diaporthe citri TaxID=83186 RepID=UPI001C813C93|nr:uncharacterized protein INS49_000870 [Diaporthe citri]KAG6366691.1 hypothetical protein INS49_000870 [Diaporthe citri]